MEYRLVTVICASHKANLCVSTAICGQRVGPRPDRTNAICANCVRYFKYMVPTYSEEFALNLRRHVTQTLEFVVGDIDSDVASNTRFLQDLYSTTVIPDSVAQVMNCGLGVWRHTAPSADVDKNEICDGLFSVLRDRLILAEEKPIVSRFFLFSNCVHTLLMSLMAKVPADVYTVNSVHPNKENAARIRRFSDWYCDPGTLPSLKVASLSLQLTQHATNLTAQKYKGEDDTKVKST